MSGDAGDAGEGGGAGLPPGGVGSDPGGGGRPAAGLRAEAGAGVGPAAQGPGPLRALVAASAVLVALALAAGLRPGQHWLTELLVVAAMGQGVLAGRVWPRFWRGPAREEVFGAGGRYAGFLAAVAFSAAEAYAVGASMGREDAPGPAVAIMLAPPLVVAALALRSAVRHRREGNDRAAAPRRRDPGGAAGPDEGPGRGGTRDGATDELTGRSLERSEGARR